MHAEEKEVDRLRLFQDRALQQACCPHVLSNCQRASRTERPAVKVLLNPLDFDENEFMLEFHGSVSRLLLVWGTPLPFDPSAR